MSNNICSVITGTGSYIPELKIPNSFFLNHEFYNAKGTRIEKSNEEIIAQFEKITGIKERRYITDDLVNSDIAFYAAEAALKSSGIDRETIDTIIVAHNFGDVKANNKKTDIVPSLASRVKQKLRIENPKTIAYDILFGCPGWLQGIIQADCYIKAGNAKRILVIGAETLSRVSDLHDVDSMIYADCAGAAILEAKESKERVGILSHAVRSDCVKGADFLKMGQSYNPDYQGNELFLKMEGHKVYVYALLNVPAVVKESLDLANLSLTDVNKVLLHQANEKMDQEILNRLCTRYNKSRENLPDNIMPLTVSWLGNSSVATIPTLLDLALKGKLENHDLKKDDIVVFASVGAGMNINSMVYKMP